MQTRAPGPSRAVTPSAGSAARSPNVRMPQSVSVSATAVGRGSRPAAGLPPAPMTGRPRNHALRGPPDPGSRLPRRWPRGRVRRMPRIASAISRAEPNRCASPSTEIVTVPGAVSSKAAAKNRKRTRPGRRCPPPAAHELRRTYSPHRPHIEGGPLGGTDWLPRLGRTV